MTPTEWDEVKNHFHRALEQSAADRMEFVASACKDETIRAEVMRLLSEHERAGSFLEQPAWVRESESPGMMVKEANVFQSTSRFDIQAQLGEGTFGIVYRAFDRQRRSIVALKLLRESDPNHLLRFKQEFRSLVGLAHPNLVQLYELFREGSQWFFTMELVEGVSFIEYVRPGNTSADWNRLREALYQLTAGVQALHSAARLHRDLKSSNVLITAEGRVVILDFGLVRELETFSFKESFTFAGSPAYMAPEQAAGRPIAEAADWYAVGVMLFRAITGHLPFQGPWNEVLRRKQVENVPPLKGTVPGIPEDLNRICDELLRREPKFRADGEFILEQLHRQSGSKKPGTERFVGRDQELQILNERFFALSSGKPQLILIEGTSGIGKSALVREFLSRLRQRHADVVILNGRCRESETLPFKALDPIADDLVRYLRSLPGPTAAGLLPRRPALLLRLFPTFGELGIPETFGTQGLPFGDQNVRAQAFAALRELLGRIADRSRLVVAIDDLQWSDLDSFAFISELILATDAPAVMLVLTVRNEGQQKSEVLRGLGHLRESAANAVCLTCVTLKGLSLDEGRALLRNVQGNTHRVLEEDLRTLIEELGGSPLLLGELLHHAFQPLHASGRGSAAQRVGVLDILRERTSVLADSARQMLEAISVAGEPLSRETLARVLEREPAIVYQDLLQLTHERLVRMVGGPAGKVEPFHDRVGEAILSGLSSENLRHWHSRLATILEDEENYDPQRAVRHHRGAGDSAAVFRSALAAAHQAEYALAFDRAAEFYAEALESQQADESTTAMLHRKRAEMLGKAGRGFEAGNAFLTSSKWSSHNDSFDMRRHAAEQFMQSGHLDEGVALFRELLRDIGLWMPAKPLSSVLAIIGLRILLWFRGTGFDLRDESEIDDATRRRLDLLWTGALVLTCVNPVFGRYLQARHLLAALRAGEPCRIADSAGLGAGFAALGGARYYLHGRDQLQFAREAMAGRTVPDTTRAVMHVFHAFLGYMCGRIGEGLDQCRNAAKILAEVGSGVSWEMVTTNMLLSWFLGWHGNLRELSELITRVLDDARLRNDVYADVVIRCFGTSHLVTLAADEPERAAEETCRALARWSPGRYDYPHLGAILVRVECDLYSRQLERARRIVLEEWPLMMRSLITRSQAVRIVLFYMRGRTAMACWLNCLDNKRLLHEVTRYADLLARTRSPWGIALSHALNAGICSGRGQIPQAIILLEQAETILRQQELRLFAAAMQRRRGELEENGAEIVQAADNFMRSEMIIRPDRMTEMILPGEWS